MKLLNELLKETKINPPEQPSKREPVMRDEYDIPKGMGPKPNFSIKTGLDGEDAATQLEIFYFNDRTYVLPSGEAQNADPWSYKGYYNAKDVKRWYVKSIQDYL